MSKLITNGLRHLGASVDNLTLDNAGRVFASNNPMFTAYKNSGVAYGSTGTTIPLADARVNVGNHFNTSTSRFTAPVAGRYFISVSGYAETNPSSFELRKNGSRINYLFLGISEGNTIWMTHAAAMVVSLNANDYLELFLATGSAGSANDSIFLSGYLLG